MLFETFRHYFYWNVVNVLAFAGQYLGRHASDKLVQEIDCVAVARTGVWLLLKKTRISAAIVLGQGVLHRKSSESCQQRSRMLKKFIRTCRSWQYAAGRQRRSVFRWR
jgi:hypothetical protein